MSLERILKFAPAWSKRPQRPGDPDYGIHCVELRAVVRGEKGAVQFVLFTGWHLPAERPRLAMLENAAGFGHPFAADLGYHSPTPQYENQSRQDDCSWLPQGFCYYDGSGLNADPVFERLIAEGDEGLWAELESYYAKLFLSKGAS